MQAMQNQHSTCLPSSIFIFCSWQLQVRKKKTWEKILTTLKRRKKTHQLGFPMHHFTSAKTSTPMHHTTQLSSFYPNQQHIPTKIIIWDQALMLMLLSNTNSIATHYQAKCTLHNMNVILPKPPLSYHLKPSSPTHWQDINMRHTLCHLNNPL